MKKSFLFVCALFFLSPASAEEKPFKIAASTTFAADLMRQIAGEHAQVDSIATPKFNVHFFQPTPADVAKTAQADLFVFYGLDLEAWADPLLEAAGKTLLFRGAERNLDLSQGVTLLKPPVNISRAHGDIHLFGNPHYASDPENVLIMARNAAERLAAIDAEHAADYRRNAEVFETKLRTKIEIWKTLAAGMRGQKVFAYHDEVAYLAQFLGFEDIAYLEPKPGIPPTPRHLAGLERLAKEQGVKLILVASYFSQKTAKKLAEKIGGKVVTIIQNPGEIEGTETIFDFYEYNVRALAEAL